MNNEQFTLQVQQHLAQMESFLHSIPISPVKLNVERHPCSAVSTNALDNVHGTTTGSAGLSCLPCVAQVSDTVSSSEIVSTADIASSNTLTLSANEQLKSAPFLIPAPSSLPQSNQQLCELAQRLQTISIVVEGRWKRYQAKV